MKKVLLILITLLLTTSPLAFGEKIIKIEEVIEVEEEVTVLKLPYGVSIVLEPDQPISRDWWHTLNLDFQQDLNTRLVKGILGFSFGNGITDFFIGYSKEFTIKQKESKDQGFINLAFTWNF